MTDKNMSEFSASAVERGTRVRVDTLSSSFNWDFFLLLAIIAAYYLILGATAHSNSLPQRCWIAPFDNMLLHLLHGEFTIDRDADMRALLMHFEITASLCVLGILSSHYVLLIHKVWSIAVPMELRLALLPFAPLAHAAFEP